MGFACLLGSALLRRLLWNPVAQPVNGAMGQQASVEEGCVNMTTRSML